METNVYAHKRIDLMVAETFCKIMRGCRLVVSYVKATAQL